jgi:coenzyme PQQ precursor peptide PqqA
VSCARAEKDALSQPAEDLIRPLEGATYIGACHSQEESIMAWTTPTLVEICIGLEINGYLPAEF